MIPKVLIMAVSIMFFLVSCGNRDAAKEHEHDEHKEHAQAHDETVDASHQSGGELVLNNGEKWNANPETTSGIRKMQEVVKKFEKGDGCSAAVRTLQEQVEEIFDKCTMEGEAHEQLHNYLYPMVKILRDLKEEQPETCEKEMAVLRVHLKEYDAYFE